MRFDAKRPCADCPFRKDRHFPLDGPRRQEIAQSLRDGFVFACHKTTVSCPGKGGLKAGPNSQACAGAEVLAERSGGGDKMAYAFSKALMGRDPSRFAADLPIYDTLEEFEADTLEARRG